MLHLVFNDRGELLNLMLTPGNVDDRKPVPKLVRKLFGKLFGDKGYLSKALRDELFCTFSVELVSGVRSNMKNVLMPLMDKILLRKRAFVETIIDQLKKREFGIEGFFKGSQSGIEWTRMPPSFVKFA